eukprot:TRINITY_DN2075_c0_g1_i1.p1 TRINITY_DN2075_c0_g1~~TRINITY_DN2075_c0_g1_i1.p1  ORF type:complete len:817 (+),score=187.21 TRINITY_DN2075_c0_g1_i1:306-2453(+)
MLNNLADMDLNWNKLTQVPAELGRLSVLKALELSSNYLINLPPEMALLSNLEMLDIAQNQFSTLPYCVYKMTNLVSFTFAANTISHMSLFVSNLSNLTRLEGRRNKLSLLPGEIGQLHKLSFLSLPSNCLSQLPAELGELTNLRELHLSHNNIPALPDSVCNLKNLKKLYLCNNKLTTLPQKFGELHSLFDLDLSNNAISTLPASFKDLNLELFNLSKNGMFYFPLHLPESMSVLTIFGNNIQSLPASVKQLVNLRQLDLHSNSLSCLPAEIGELTQLRVLDVCFNKLASLPKELGRLSLLQSLNVSFNRLQTVPDTVASLTSLSCIHLGFNALRALPDMHGLTNLMELHLSGNRFDCIPPTVLALPSLRRLRAACLSCLSAMPSEDEMQALAELEVLDLSYNLLQKADAVCRLSHLSELDLAFNNLAIVSSDLASSPGFYVHGNVADVPSAGSNIHYSRDVDAKYVGWSEMCGRRPDMQDAVCIWPRFVTSPTSHLVGVFDGHAGVQVAQYAAQQLPSLLRQQCVSEVRPELALGNALGDLQRNIDAQKDALPDGSTAIVAYLTETEVVVANIGDSRAVLCDVNNRAIPLSQDHKPDSPHELKRIVNMGGFVTPNARVLGELALARSLGDNSLKPYVSADADVCVRTLEPGDKFIILACDGVWDVLTSQAAVDVVVNSLATSGSPIRASIELRDAAFCLGSNDNISVIVLLIDK